jgi:hypothetical protein
MAERTAEKTRPRLQFRVGINVGDIIINSDDIFGDGMVEEIITALSRFKSLFVIARNSSLTFKGGAVNIKEVGRQLGVRYVLEGSVRKCGSAVQDGAGGGRIPPAKFTRRM